jgi:hypothetical protein
LNVSGITTFHNITTCLSSLSVSGTTNLNNATSFINVSGITTLSNDTNIIGTLNISGFTLLNNFNTTNSPLYIDTNQPRTISALSVNSTSASILVNTVQNLGWNDGANYALNATGYSMFGGVQINGQDSLNSIYKRAGDSTIASPSTRSIILKSDYGNWEAMRLNSAGISMNTSLHVSGLTIINNATTCTSSLNVSGITTLSNNVYFNATTLNSGSTLDVGGSSATTYYSFSNRLRISGNDPNTIWQTSAAQPSIRLTTSSTSTCVYHSIGNASMKTTTGSGGFGINTGYNVNPRCALEASGVACVDNASPSAPINDFMQSGSLTIGGVNANYGTGGNEWSSNAVGCMLECLDDTEICLDDAGARVASLMY